MTSDPVSPPITVQIPGGWLKLASILLAFVGFLISLNLALAKFNHAQNLCPAGSGMDCELVVRSAYAWVGPIPVAYLGSVGYFLIMLFPFLGFFDQSYFPMSFVADHYQYVAIPGVIALVVGASSKLAARLTGLAGRRYSRLLVAVVILILGTLTWKQSQVYFNDETLWRDTIAKNPTAWLAHYNLGVILATNGRFSDATAAYETALRLKPDYAEALGNLGIVLMQQGRTGEAVSRWRAAIRCRPDHVDSLNNLGAAYAQQGDLRHAALYFSLVLMLKPNDSEAHANLGMVYLNQGKWTRAVDQFQAALQSAPQMTQVRRALEFAQTRAKLEEGRVCATMKSGL